MIIFRDEEPEEREPSPVYIPGPALSDEVTLGDARQWFQDRVRDGVRCPCCTKFAKVYRRRLNSGAARALILMWHAGGRDRREWVHLPTSVHPHMQGVGAYTMQKFWGLIEADPERQAWWRVTEDGQSFIRGVHTVPLYVETYDDRLLLTDGGMITIRDALGTRFDYEELMRTPGTVNPLERLGRRV